MCLNLTQNKWLTLTPTKTLYENDWDGEGAESYVTKKQSPHVDICINYIPPFKP